MPNVTPLHAEDPTRLGRYRLTGRITGMAAAGPVYLARTVDGGDVMITLFAGDWTADSAVRDRFTAEANAAGRVAPFCAARILGAGFDRGQAFLVSEYIAGPSLLEYVTERGPWEGRDLVALAIGTATGLAAIHQAGLVHGDFGPQHVVLGADGPRVVEFGITPPYGAATPAADMRAWARTVLFAAAGRAADPASPRDLAVLPGALRMLTLQSLSMDPAGQLLSARSVVTELLGDPSPPAGVLGEGSRRAAQAAVRPAAEPASEASTAHRGGRRRAVTVWWVVGVAICILVIAIAIRFADKQGGQPANVAASSPPPHNSATARAGQPTPSPAIPAALAGTWSGQVSQTSPADVFSVTITLASGGRQGSVHYRGTSFSCSGVLVATARQPGGLQLEQHIVHGPCEGGVVTLVTGHGNSVQFGFKGKQGPAATGTLTRS